MSAELINKFSNLSLQDTFNALEELSGTDIGILSLNNEVYYIPRAVWELINQLNSRVMELQDEIAEIKRG